MNILVVDHQDVKEGTCRNLRWENARGGMTLTLPQLTKKVDATILVDRVWKAVE